MVSFGLAGVFRRGRREWDLVGGVDGGVALVAKGCCVAELRAQSAALEGSMAAEGEVAVATVVAEVAHCLKGEWRE